MTFKTFNLPSIFLFIYTRETSNSVSPLLNVPPTPTHLYLQPFSTPHEILYSMRFAGVYEISLKVIIFDKVKPLHHININLDAQLRYEKFPMLQKL